MMASALLRAGLHVAVVDIPLDGRRVTSAPQGWDTLTVERPLFPVSIFCLPPFEMMRLKVERGAALFHARRNIGCWPWELTTLPAEWQSGFEIVDEVWAISPFLADVYGRLTTKPVQHVRPHVGLPAVEPVSRAELDLEDDNTVILSMFDLNSFIARKNPEGSVAAFQQAFPDRESRERLVIKTLNGAANPELLASLMTLAGTDRRIRIIDGAWPRGRTPGLIAAADVLLSLHRAEGFGRILAEAMLLGVPVVATAWSGVLSYLTAETGWPVSCKLRAVRQGEYIYSDGSFWAEPDIADAAETLRSVIAQPAEAARRAGAAREHIRQLHGLDAVALHLASLLAPTVRS
jgi:glycosyltransferase involved in cell wall biosynthesis